MEKTVNLVVNETKVKIVQTLNESNLPVSIISLIVENLLFEIKEQEKNILKSEIEKYEASLNNEQNPM